MKKLDRGEVILFSGMAVFAAGFLYQLYQIHENPSGGCAYDCSPFPWPMIIGGAIGLVCFIIAMRGTFK